MSSVEALHAEIVANPASPDAYLVLADLLTSQGDPRGELIALQSRLATGATDRMLRVRAKKLLDRYVNQLQRETGARGEWHLGYVRAGTPADAQSLRRLFAHPSACVMTELQIHRTIHDDEDTRGHESAVHSMLAALGEQPRPSLRTLSIRVDYNPSGDGYDRRRMRRRVPAELAVFPHTSWDALPNLERLVLAGDPIVPALALPRLHELVLEGTPIADGPWELPQLRALDWMRHVQRVNRWEFGAALRQRRVERERQMLDALWNHALPALCDLTLRGEFSGGVLMLPAATDRVANLRRLCVPAAALGSVIDPARLRHLERLVVTEIDPDAVPPHVRRALRHAAWTAARSTDRRVSLAAKRLPRR